MPAYPRPAPVQPDAKGPLAGNGADTGGRFNGVIASNLCRAMTLLLLAYLAGVLTIVSPCILPVLPFVLARADRPFRRNGLPMLLGMAVIFTLVATLAAVGGSWAVEANSYGRLVALGLLAVFALTLLLPGLAERLARPLVALGARWAESAARHDGQGTGPGPWVSSLLLGAATGLLWAPCAGPVLGLILTGAAIHGANLGTSLLLLAYAAGAATSLALSLLVGGRVYALLKRSLGVGQWLRRGTGVAVLGSVALIATGVDTGLLSRLSLGSTATLEQTLLDVLKTGDAHPPAVVPVEAAPQPAQALPGPAAFNERSGRELPSLEGATHWLHSPPLGRAELRGKVVLIDFWTYSCINCLRTLPYVRAWADKYRDAGLVVIGVHSPEFAFEKNLAHVRRAVADLGIRYPVAVDSDHAIWRAFGNRYWPALYFVDAQGRLRHHVFGEGRYAEAEGVIQALLAEAGAAPAGASLVSVQGQGAEAAPGTEPLSGETYLGHARTEGFVPPGGIARDRAHPYQAAAALRLNQWTLDGTWKVEAERAVATAPGARLAYRFGARDLHLVLGRTAGAPPVRFRVWVDGQPAGDVHGSDVSESGAGVLDAHRLYQLVRRASSAGEALFEIEFLDAGAEVYAFTFG
jgi:cytochrome c biogenesis protein CcdA/thiol-disulfide isomerase/thioredoxin